MALRLAVNLIRKSFADPVSNEDSMAFGLSDEIVLPRVQWTNGRHSILRRIYAVKSLRLVRQRFGRK